MESPVIWLCDLTYTQQSISNDTIPSAIGGIGANILCDYPDASVQIFKYPEDLSHCLDLVVEDGCIPDIISFSNYVWNANLSYAYCSVIKDVFPQILTVSGGANFPFALAEQKDFLAIKPFLDLYLQKEGEVAWSKLGEVWKTSADLGIFLC
ncbi:MAG: hypothetical protein AAGG51_28590 [Cyanobacteria bacterium P01_G01_bin.54]